MVGGQLKKHIFFFIFRYGVDFKNNVTTEDKRTNLFQFQKYNKSFVFHKFNRMD